MWAEGAHIQKTFTRSKKQADGKNYTKDQQTVLIASSRCNCSNRDLLQALSNPRLTAQRKAIRLQCTVCQMAGAGKDLGLLTPVYINSLMLHRNS